MTQFCLNRHRRLKSANIYLKFWLHIHLRYSLQYLRVLFPDTIYVEVRYEAPKIIVCRVTLATPFGVKWHHNLGQVWYLFIYLFIYLFDQRQYSKCRSLQTIKHKNVWSGITRYENTKDVPYTQKNKNNKTNKNNVKNYMQMKQPVILIIKWTNKIMNM